jgi:CubicO group peptidase (beta-lactamase class C family)
MAHPALERRDITLQETVDAIAATPLVTAPGEWCAYGDVSIQVAGRVAEVASGIKEPSGRAWRILFESRLSTPLGMTATSCEGAAPTRNPHLSGGATSTPRDYARFLVMLLNEGTSNGRRVLSASAVNELLRNQIGASPLRFNPFQLFPDLHPGWRDVRYGLGAWIEAMDGTTALGLDASAPGIFGFIPWIDRGRNLAGVFLADRPLDKTLPVYLKLKALLRRQR